MNVKYSGVAACLLILLSPAAMCAEYFVSPAGNDSSPGTENSPWRTIDKANRSALAGDTINIRQGEYNEVIYPVFSGRAGSPIRYKAYAGEKVVISNPPPDESGTRTAIDLDGRNFIEIDGLRVDGKRLSGGGKDSNVDAFIKFNNSDFNTIKNCFFQYANGWAGVHISGGSDFNRFLNNSFDAVGTNHIPDGYTNAGEDRGDIMVIKHASHNIVQGNSFSRGGHDTLAVIGSFNVIRGNDFNGKWTGTDSPGARAAGDLSGNIKYGVPEPRGFNLFELNTVRNAAASGDNPANNGMKIQGTNQIVRGNYFFDNIATAVVAATRTGKIESVRHNRIYNNTFFNNNSLFIYRDYDNLLPFNDNIWKNNLVADHKSGTQARILIDVSASINPNATNDMNETVLAGNIFEPTSNGTINLQVAFAGQSITEEIGWYEQRFPKNVYNNRISTINFLNTSARSPAGFQVQAGSPAIDTATALTRTVGAGTGRLVRIEDARYFYDGFGISGETGDMIVIADELPAEIIGIDYVRNELELARSIKWSDNAPVNLQHVGSGSDVGAHEIYELRARFLILGPPSSSEPKPLPPTAVTVN